MIFESLSIAEELPRLFLIYVDKIFKKRYLIHMAEETRRSFYEFSFKKNALF